MFKSKNHRQRASELLKEKIKHNMIINKSTGSLLSQYSIRQCKGIYAHRKYFHILYLSCIISWLQFYLSTQDSAFPASLSYGSTPCLYPIRTQLASKM